MMRNTMMAAGVAAILLAGCSKSGPPPKREPGSWSQQIELKRFEGKDAEKAKAGLAQMFAMMSGPNLSAEARERINAASMNTPQYVLVSAMEGMADPSIWGDDKINVPVLAIMAKNPFFPPDIEQAARGIAPKLEFQMWEGVGHFIMIEKPKEFNEAVLAFLDKNALLKN